MALCTWGAGLAAQALAGPHHTQTPSRWVTSLPEHQEGATMDIRVHHPRRGVNLPKACGQITGSPFPGSRNLLPLCWLLFLSFSPRVRMRMSTCISPWPLTVKPPGETSHIAGKVLTHLAARCSVRFDKEPSGFVSSPAKTTPAHPCPGAAGAVLCVQLHQQTVPSLLPARNSIEFFQESSHSRCLHPADDKSLPERTGCTACLWLS